MDVLLIGAARHLGVAAHAETARRALRGELHLHLLPFKLRRAKAITKDLLRDAAVFQTLLNVELIALAVDNARLG